MAFLFHETIFGPIRSRRLGNSLGVNLLPTEVKFCNFDCIYCECGWTNNPEPQKMKLPPRSFIMAELEQRLALLQKQGQQIDSITFAGNGEPTLHPDFSQIIDDTLLLRDRYFPQARVSVLSNAAMLHRESVIGALLKTDNPILKLDAGSEAMFQKIDRPLGSLTLAKLVSWLERFNGQLVIQTLFLRGTYQGQEIDNTSEEEVSAWLALLQKIKPRHVMLYPVERATPAENLEKISASELEEICRRVEELGITASVYG